MFRKLKKHFLHTEITEDKIEVLKYEIVHNLFVFYFLGIFTSVLFIVSSKEITLGPNVWATVLFLSCIVFLRKTKNYKIVSVFASVFAFVILTYTFLSVHASQFLSPLWMIVNIIFSFLIVGRIWGIFVLAGHFSIYFFSHCT
jgi:hypothetical protein